MGYKGSMGGTLDGTFQIIIIVSLKNKRKGNIRIERIEKIRNIWSFKDKYALGKF